MDLSHIGSIMELKVIKSFSKCTERFLTHHRSPMRTNVEAIAEGVRQAGVVP